MPSDAIFSCLTLSLVSNSWLHLFSDLLCSSTSSIVHGSSGQLLLPLSFTQFLCFPSFTSNLGHPLCSCLLPTPGAEGTVRIPAHVKPQIPATLGASGWGLLSFHSRPPFSTVAYLKLFSTPHTLHPSTPPFLLLMASFSSSEKIEAIVK